MPILLSNIPRGDEGLICSGKVLALPSCLRKVHILPRLFAFSRSRVAHLLDSNIKEYPWTLSLHWEEILP